MVDARHGPAAGPSYGATDTMRGSVVPTDLATRPSARPNLRHVLDHDGQWPESGVRDSEVVGGSASAFIRCVCDSSAARPAQKDRGLSKTERLWTHTICYVLAGWYARRETKHQMRYSYESRLLLPCLHRRSEPIAGSAWKPSVAKMRAYASLYDLTIVEVIIDAGESAKSLNRPGLQACPGMLKAGKADGLLIVKLDRLTRSIADWQDLIDAYFGERGGKQLSQRQRQHRHPHGRRPARSERFDYRRSMGAGNHRRTDPRCPAAQDQQRPACRQGPFRLRSWPPMA